LRAARAVLERLKDSGDCSERYDWLSDLIFHYC
jgi:hypothetical protein